ncbi:hypothetical protein ACSSS7_005437 [Eimeria intestinalis]
MLDFSEFQREPDTEPPAHPFDLVRAPWAQEVEEFSASRSETQFAEEEYRRPQALRGHKSLALGSLLLLLFVLLEGLAKKDETVHDVLVGPIRASGIGSLISRFSPPQLVVDMGALLLSAAASLVLGGLYENVVDHLGSKQTGLREPYPLRGMIPAGVGMVLVLIALFNSIAAPNEFSVDPGDASLCLGFGLGLLLVGAGLLHHSRMQRQKGSRGKALLR